MRFSPDAPIQIGGCGCCTGRGSSVASCTWKCRPSNVKPSVVSRPRTICTASSNASMRSFSAGNGMPSSWCSLSNHAAPYDELEAAARRVVDGDRLGREHRRVAVGHAGRRAGPSRTVLGDAAPRRERRVALEASRPVPRRTSAGSGRTPRCRSKPSSSANRARSADLATRACAAARCRVRTPWDAPSHDGVPRCTTRERGAPTKRPSSRPSPASGSAPPSTSAARRRACPRPPPHRRRRGRRGR